MDCEDRVACSCLIGKEFQGELITVSQSLKRSGFSSRIVVRERDLCSLVLGALLIAKNFNVDSHQRINTNPAPSQAARKNCKIINPCMLKEVSKRNDLKQTKLPIIL